MVDKISRGEDRGAKTLGGKQDKLIRHIHIKEDKYTSLDDGSVDGLTTGPGGEDKWLCLVKQSFYLLYFVV